MDLDTPINGVNFLASDGDGDVGTSGIIRPYYKTIFYFGLDNSRPIFYQLII